MHPWQAGTPPAANGVASIVRVSVALEAFENIVAIQETGSRGNCSRVARTKTAATDEQQQRFMINGALEFADEVRVQMFLRIVLPLNFDGLGNAANPLKFCVRTHIDQPGAWRMLQYMPGLSRRQRALVSKIKVAAALLGKLKDFAKLSHGFGVKR